MTTPARTIGQACHALHPIGTHLIDCAATLAEIRDELPKRGHLVDLYIQLVANLALTQHAYHNANQALLTAYHELEHSERAQREGWTPQPLNRNGHP